MPLYDGTGPPEGTGPMTGRQMGVEQQPDPLFVLFETLNQFMPHNVLCSLTNGGQPGMGIRQLGRPRTEAERYARHGGPPPPRGTGFSKIY